MRRFTKCLTRIDCAVLACPLRFQSQELKLARVFAMELNKLRLDFRRCGKEEALLVQALATPLTRVSGLDGKTLAQYLSTLATFGIHKDHPAVAVAATWLSANLPLFNGITLAHSLHSLAQIRYDELPSVVETLRPKISQSLHECSAVALVHYLYCFSVVGSAASGALLTDVLPRLEQCHSELQLADVVVTVKSCSELIRLDALSPCSKLLVQVLERFHSIPSTPEPRERAELIIATLTAMIAEGQRQGGDAIARVGAQVVQSLFDGLLKDESVCQGCLEENHLLLPLLIQCCVVANSLSQKMPQLQAVVEAVAERSALKDLTTLTKLPITVLCEIFLTIRNGSPNGCAPPVGSLETIAAAIGEHCRASLVTKEVLSTVDAPTASRIATVLELVYNDSAAFVAALQPLLKQRLQLLRDKESAVAAGDVLPLVPALISAEVHDDLGAVANDSATGWSTSEVCGYVTALSSCRSKTSRRLLRDVAPRILGHVSRASPSQLARIASAYGACTVRHDSLCEAISNRAISVANDLTIHQASVILGGLAAVEYRVNQVFLDLASLVLSKHHEASAPQVTNLIAAYAKLMIWNYKLFAALSRRAFEVRSDLSPLQMITILTSFTRMDFTHDDLLAYFLQHLKPRLSQLSLFDCVQIASTFSQTSSWDRELFDNLAERFIRDQSRLDAALLGEGLLAFARVPALRDHPIFNETSLRALALAPTCPPLPMAHIATSYALAQLKADELFAVFSDRLLSAKEEFPSIVIGAILHAFACVGIRDDRLFIEMIPRVRHVASYGDSRDVANVVMAYSKTGLWHYKLFARLAERAVQIKGECRGQQIAEILGSYGKVGMRHEKLFTDFSPRVQALSHLLLPGEITEVLKAYATVEMFDQSLFAVLTERVVLMVESFSKEQLQQISAAWDKCPFPQDDSLAIIKKRLSDTPL